ncbi:MAG: hypothetical protein HZC40_24360 [Chloroflexi bacterium]|nr:hypothetical protein [Chloroflexota bacterium]
MREISPVEREQLLIKNWMSHDARWFMAVAQEFGMAVANRLNQVAARGIGKVEAQRLARALELAPIQNRDEYLAAQTAFIALLGPDLLDYRVNKIGDDTFELQVERCFAYDNVLRAGVADQYACGILPRVLGWLDALNVQFEIAPPIAKCLKTQNQDCSFVITISDRTI